MVSPAGLPPSWKQLPRALRAQSAAQIRAFEEVFEPLGLAALALHARLRLIPNLSDENLSGLAWHIRGITALAIAFVVVGGLLRLGGLG
ncbi:hypothetical protein [Synechococcus sp. BA-132 BA5]|uniref:hypothetical protein n=1 Tax=Synechococcus sp. BA-132 BA5 TaxID=3110252 RepID=UPI002B1E953F|nr:hypothetical protein [Synechococcus sp. BA-132 BA5]MEA5417157.1 hypothetical protein [Synechococcus sp. BA-132 BA5]